MAARNIFEEVAPRIDDWVSRNESLKDLKHSLGPPTSTPCVFVSYRSSDRSTAQDAADYLRASGVDVYFDHRDHCLEIACATGGDLAIAICLEIALDRSNALLSITTEDTFTSPWPPYEIGSARGRAKFTRSFAAAGLLGLPAPPAGLSRAHAIGHLLTNNVSKVPGFVFLGVPIIDRPMLQAWTRLLLTESELQGAAMPPAPTMRNLPHARNPGELRFD